MSADHFAGIAALALIAACGLLPMLGHMRVAMRNPTPDELLQSAGVRLAESMLAVIEDEQAHAAGIHGRMYADGLLPDRRRRARAADITTTAQEGTTP